MARAKGYSVQINTKALVQKHQKAFAEANESLEAAFNYQLGAPIWNWPRETERQNGTVVGSPRDARDSGALIDSYEREKRGANTFVHAWRVPWAVPVHNGAVLRSGTVLPARPWSEEPIRALPQMFADAYRKRN